MLLVAALARVVALAAREGTVRHLGLCAFAALLAFVTLGKVFSPQYVIWLAPFAALAWAWRARAVGVPGAAIVLTHVEFPSRYSTSSTCRPGRRDRRRAQRAAARGALRWSWQ